MDVGLHEEVYVCLGYGAPNESSGLYLRYELPLRVVAWWGGAGGCGGKGGLSVRTDYFCASTVVEMGAKHARCAVPSAPGEKKKKNTARKSPAQFVIKF